MKTIFKGMVLLLAGASFVACSKDVSFDENAQKQAEQAKKQAQLDQKYASYESNFVKTFGAIAPGHKWGFDQTAVVKSRGSVTNSELSWFIPENFRTPSQNKEGIEANTIRDNMSNLTTTLPNFNFNNFWLQHVESPDHTQGKSGKGVGQLQAYSQPDGWVDVANFTGGMNSNGKFVCEGINVYINNNALHNTTLMANMGTAKEPGTGYQFRYKQDGEWCYDYYFFNYGGSTFLCLKRYYAKKGETSWWIIRIAEAETGDETLYRGRVLCEDMGEIGDYDFNDVVFDAEILENNDIEVSVVAAGGILPIYIGGSPEEGGIKVDLGKMVNTGEHNGVKHQKITFKANRDGSPKFASIHAVPVWVDPGGEAIPYELKAEDGKAPQKICTYKLTAYPDEYIRIDNAYKGFAEWVNTQNPNKWSEHVNWWLIDLDLTNNAHEPVAEDVDED